MNYDFLMLLSFVCSAFREGDNVDYFAEAATDAFSVYLFNVGCVEVSGDVGDEVIGDEEIVPTEKDLGHDVAFAAEMFEILFGSQVVKADGLGCFGSRGYGEAAFAVAMNGI
ncbi:MAG: hypothetical protein JEZ14_25940 [Marinilabiliaceae bacterium]|nr:hypothetical protein [Marinilabiliaceae bacterium]